MKALEEALKRGEPFTIATGEVSQAAKFAKSRGYCGKWQQFQKGQSVYIPKKYKLEENE